MGHINIGALFAALDVQRSTQGLSWRNVGRITGLAASTFTRLGHGYNLDLDGYVVCCRWLGVSLEDFVTGQLAAKPANLAGELSTLLRRYGVPMGYWTPLSSLIYQLANPEE
jgi:hypothetical protein